jgi:hypothetical protein
MTSDTVEKAKSDAKKGLLMQGRRGLMLKLMQRLM